MSFPKIQKFRLPMEGEGNDAFCPLRPLLDRIEELGIARAFVAVLPSPFPNRGPSAESVERALEQLAATGKLKDEAATETTPAC